MARGTIDPKRLAHIHQHAAEAEDKGTERAYDKMKYKRKAKIENGNLVLTARLQRIMANAEMPKVQAWGTEMPEISDEQRAEILAAFDSLDGEALLGIVTGQIDIFSMAKQALETKIKNLDNNNIETDGE